MVTLTLAKSGEEEMPPNRGDFIADVQVELDGYYVEMKQFLSMEPTEIYMKLAAWSARASEIRSRLVRQESRKAQAFRTREVDPFIDECDRQFKIYSRIQSCRQQEWDMQRGV